MKNKAKTILLEQKIQAGNGNVQSSGGHPFSHFACTYFFARFAPEATISLLVVWPSTRRVAFRFVFLVLGHLVAGQRASASLALPFPTLSSRPTFLRLRKKKALKFGSISIKKKIFCANPHREILRFRSQRLRNLNVPISGHREASGQSLAP